MLGKPKQPRPFRVICDGTLWGQYSTRAEADRHAKSLREHGRSAQVHFYKRHAGKR